jgi:hypothetical protein
LLSLTSGLRFDPPGKSVRQHCEELAARQDFVETGLPGQPKSFDVNMRTVPDQSRPVAVTCQIRDKAGNVESRVVKIDNA